MNELVWIALATLTVYRVSHMLALEDGPFDLFITWREWIGTDLQRTWIQRGFGCPACISFWAALATTILIANSYPTNFIGFMLIWLGTAGATLFLLKWSN